MSTLAAPKKITNQLIVIQYLRAIAALMVVIHHAREPQAWLYNPLEAYPAFAWGVDIFFVISGFIMYVAATNEKPYEFIKKRIIRVVPLYWFATLLLLLILTKFKPFTIPSNEFLHLIQSFFFIPHYSPGSHEKIYPYLIAGWTLNYEMFFYAIFGVGLAFKRTALICSLVIIGLVIIGNLFNFDNAIMKAYTSSILMEFLGGLWIGYFYRKRIIPAQLSILMLVGFTFLFSIPFIQTDYVMAMRIISSIFVILGAAAFIHAPVDSRLLALLGDASYSIYLTHSVLSIRIAHKVWSSAPVTVILQFIVWLCLTLIISIIIGVLVYWLVEKPALIWLRSKVR
jgi:exopolysaccharide production protein ExoZ